MPTLRVYLNRNMLPTARSGRFPFMTVLRRAVESQGWDIAFEPAGPRAHDNPPPDGDYALFDKKRPLHPRTLTFRRAYHYPFWWIEPVAERWRFAVARATFDSASVDPDEAAAFVRGLRERVLPGPAPTRGEQILVPLQNQLREVRSFQTMSPIEMLDTICRSGRPVVATTHPTKKLDGGERTALKSLAAWHRNLTIGGDTRKLLRECNLVATQNSAVAFDGLILGKPAVLFGQIDFHHPAFNVADLGAAEALTAAEAADGNADRYIWWFLKHRSIDAQAPDAEERILAAMRAGGWPI